MSDNSRQYSNDEITVFWKPARCIHATTCFRELISVFNPRNRPWIDMNGAPTERIIEVVNKCPTAALSFAYNKDLVDKPIKEIVQDVKNELTPETIYDTKVKEKDCATVSIKKNGPILVEGEFVIIDENGEEMQHRIMTSFCRCGYSYSQPFCDGNHKKFGFQD